MILLYKTFKIKQQTQDTQEAESVCDNKNSDLVLWL